MCKDERDETIKILTNLLIPHDNLNNINDKFKEIDKSIEDLHEKLNKYFTELLDLLKYVDELKDFTVKVDKKVKNLEEISKYNSSVVNKIYESIKEKLSTVEKQFEYN